MNKYIYLLFLILSVFILGNPANADFSAIGGPGIINKENIEQLKNLDIEKKVIQTTESDIEQQQKNKQKEERPEEFIEGDIIYDTSFILNKVIFDGNSVISDKKLQKIAEKLVGQEVHIEDILNLTLEISRYYQQQGYITSFAFVEEQEIEDGVVKISVKESRIAKKEVQGNKWEKDVYLKHFVIAGPGLNENNVFNARALQGAMKNISKESYYKGTVSLSRDENKDTVINLNVEDRYPLKLEMAWDDFGRDYTGRQRFTTIAGIDNLTGFGDKIYGGAILSQDSKGAVAGYEIPIGRWGTRLGADYSRSNVYIGGPYRPYDISGYSNDYIIRLTQPIINTATKQLDFILAFDMLDSKTESGYFNEVLSDYALRVLRTSFYGMFDDKYGRIVANIGADIGFDGLGASQSIKNGPHSAFYKFVAGIARVQRLPKECLGILRVNGQYSHQALFPVEQMYIGGAYSLRGYQPSELIGDYGVAGSIETRTPVPGIKYILPKSHEDDWAKKVRLVFFYDWGYVKEHDDLYNYPTNFLHSLGFGCNINMTDALLFQMGVGFPLSRKLNESAGRVYFTLNSKMDKLFMHTKYREEL